MTVIPSPDRRNAGRLEQRPRHPDEPTLAARGGIHNPGGSPSDDAVISRAALGALALAVGVACGSGAPEPASLDTRNEQCASCRMTVSDVRFASQLVAPGELPRFFDDLGCLGEFLEAGRAPAGATAFVADHRTKAWVRADRAVYTRVPGLTTPMGSHVIAHADAISRDQDADAREGAPVTPAGVFGPAGPPTGGAR